MYIQHRVSPNNTYFVMTSTIFDSFRLKHVQGGHGDQQAIGRDIGDIKFLAKQDCM